MSPCCPAEFEASLDGLFASRYRYREGEAIKTTQFGKLKFCTWGAGDRNVRVICKLIY